MGSNREPTLGVHLLETITKGMYSNPLHSVREYIQNAYDSIRVARRNGLLKAGEGEVKIEINPELRTVRIRDNGTGLSPEAASVYLYDLGNSAKAGIGVDSMKNAGFRGIGRMAGITYCKKLRFETSNGNGKKCIVEFDAVGINRLTRADKKAATIVDAIQNNTELREDEETTGKHYLEVVLDGVNDAGRLFLDENELNAYLSQVAPVDHDPAWKFSDKIHSFAKNAQSLQSLEHIAVTIRDAEGNRRFDVRRPFRNTFNTTARKIKRTVNVRDVVELPRDEAAANGWWGWLAVHDRQGALMDIPFSGLRLRMHNIAIGDDSIIRDLFVTSSHAIWCFGEVHITDHGLTPNAQRDNFEDSKEWNLIKEQLRVEAMMIGKEIRRESVQRNSSVETLRKRTDERLKDAQKLIKRRFVSPEQQQSTVQKLEHEVQKLSQHAEKGTRTDEEREKISKMCHEVERVVEQAMSVKVTESDIAQSHLGREGRRVFRTVREILQSELEEDVFRAIIKKINFALQPGRRP